MQTAAILENVCESKRGFLKLSKVIYIVVCNIMELRYYHNSYYKDFIMILRLHAMLLSVMLYDGWSIIYLHNNLIPQIEQ